LKLPTNESTQTFKRNQQKKISANVETTSRKQVKPKSSTQVIKCKVKMNAAGLYEWKTLVTEAMARRSKTQVLVSFINL
jgi:hypothetical protein